MITDDNWNDRKTAMKLAFVLSKIEIIGGYSSEWDDNEGEFTDTVTAPSLGFKLVNAIDTYWGNLYESKL